jgi:predicted nucleic acid-binding Zn ribbon protein
MRYDAYCSDCDAYSEIQKAMTAPMPDCSVCGAQLRRVYRTAPPVFFHASGFYATDYEHFERQVGPERADKFRKSRDDAQARAKRGKLTSYEQALEGI